MKVYLNGILDELLSQREDLIGDAIDKSVKRLMEIENRAKAARPGPWKAAEAGSNVLDPELSKPGAPYYWKSEDDCILDQNEEEVLGCSEWMRVDWVDLEFMAHAREDIDFLLAEIKRLREMKLYFSATFPPNK